MGRTCIVLPADARKRCPVTCHIRTEDRGIALRILNLSARRWVVNATPSRFAPREGDLVPIVPEGGWASGPVWMGPENLAPAESRTVQPVASPHIDYASQPPLLLEYKAVVSGAAIRDTTHLSKAQF
jgi:hypothetical protein